MRSMASRSALYGLVSTRGLSRVVVLSLVVVRVGVVVGPVPESGWARAEVAVAARMISESVVANSVLENLRIILPPLSGCQFLLPSLVLPHIPQPSQAAYSLNAERWGDFDN